MRHWLVVTSLLALACAAAPASPGKPPAISPGRPSFEGKPAGFWVWADGEGWHLRTTSAGVMADFSGVITPIDGKVENLRPMRTDSRYDKLQLTERGIEFTLPTWQGTEGFDWTVTSGCNRFQLLARGEPDPGLVRLGAMEEAPERIPFERCR